jgi:hypothetical protein
MKSVSPDAAVNRDASGPNANDSVAGSDDVPSAGEKEVGGGDREATGAAKDSTSDIAAVLQGQEAGGLETAATGGRDLAEAGGTSEVGGAKETGDASEAGGASEAGDAKETGGTSEVGTAREAGGAIETGGPEVCTGIVCNVDFPCPPDRPSSCARGNPKSIVNYVTVGCAEVCGTPCCSGATCQGRSQDCPSGTACAYPSPPTTALGAKAQCFDESRTCGGADNKPCASGQYCEHFETLCSGSSCPSPASACSEIKAGVLGTCMPMPRYDSTECIVANPVCGCDGVTYENECARKAANAAMAHRGACP